MTNGLWAQRKKRSPASSLVRQHAKRFDFKGYPLTEFMKIYYINRYASENKRGNFECYFATAKYLIYSLQKQSKKSTYVTY